MSRKNHIPHAIVVGAGIGGLAAALDLLGAGVRVTVVERHAHPGGKMREVRIADRTIDSGPTVMTMRWIFDDLFARAGLRFQEFVQLHSSDLLARHSWLDGSRLDLFTDTSRSTEAISAFAGAKEAQAYQHFVNRSARTFDTLDRSFMRAARPNTLQLAKRIGLRGMPGLFAANPFRTLWKELGATFSDPRLIQLFGRYSTYCGSSPFMAPSTLMLIAEAERRGVWLVEGGMQRVADAFAAAIQALGGELCYQSHVAEVRTQGRRVSAVVLENGAVLKADAVVFNGDTQALAEGAAGTAVKAAAVPRGPDGFTLSAVTLSAVAKTNKFPLSYHTVFFGDDYADEFAAVFKRGEICTRPTVYICAQDRIRHTAPDTDKERIFCLINAPPRLLDREFVEASVATLLSHLATHGLELDYEESEALVTSPTQFAELFPSSRGALYGRPTHGPWGSFSRPGAATPVQGLFLAGGSVHPGAGIPMAAQSGCLAAEAAKAYLDHTD